jgi:hypothetical protein
VGFDFLSDDPRIRPWRQGGAPGNAVPDADVLFRGLRAYRDDPMAMGRLFSLLGEVRPELDPSRMEADEVLRCLAWLVRDGFLVWDRPGVREVLGAGLRGQSSRPLPPPPAKKPTPPPKPAPPPKTAPSPPAAQGNQAGAYAGAAKAGTPFCEFCSKT